jgi:hypothetical protein
MRVKQKFERVLSFDIKTLQQRALIGVRRAFAFLGLSERFLEYDFPRSLTVGQTIRYQFLPDPLPEAVVPELRKTWRDWIIGNTLRELDQFLSLFLDGAFEIVQKSRLVSGENPPNHKWKGIADQTNVAAKHLCVLNAVSQNLDQHNVDQKCLHSLSQVRNCLSHDLGIVTAKRSKTGKLKVNWLFLRLVVKQDDRLVTLKNDDLPFIFDPEGGEGYVQFSVDIEERLFDLGDHLQFTPDDLLSICLFYNGVIDRVSLMITEYAKECGVIFDDSNSISCEV